MVIYNVNNFLDISNRQHFMTYNEAY